MARPSKKQLAERKAQKKVEGRYHRLEKECWRGAFDEFEAACEHCGQVQSGQNPVCVVCGDSYAVWMGETESPVVIRSRCDFPLPNEPGAVRPITC